MSEDKLSLLRQRIDEVDDQLLNLLNQRAEFSKGIAEIKQKEDPNLRNIYQPIREADILLRLTENSHGPFSASAIANIFNAIFKESKELQKRS